MEIDESYFGKKNMSVVGLLDLNSGFFGGIDLTTRQCFFVSVAQRNADTLIPIIEEYILPGTEIFIT